MRQLTRTIWPAATFICVLATFSATVPATEPASQPATIPAAINGLTREQQEKLLKLRLSGAMGLSLRDFANMFLVKSNLQLGTGVCLVTSANQIATADLISPFPESYSPTLREFLDSIALQTSSEWKYDPTGKYISFERTVES